MAGSTVQLTFDSKLGPFVQDAARAAKAVAGIEGGTKKLSQALRAAEHDIDRTGSAVDRIGSKGDRATLSMRKLGQAFTSAFGGFGLASLMSQAISSFTSDIQRLETVLTQFVDARKTLSSARKDLIRNMAGSTTEERAAAIRASDEIAAETHTERRVVTSAMAEAMSASGGNFALSRDAVRLAAKLYPDRPAEIAQVAGQMIDLAPVTGTNDAATNAGLLMRTAATSRVVDPRAQATSIGPAIIGQDAQGSTYRGASSMFSALTAATGDLTGRTSGTAAINLAKQLNNFEITDPVTGLKSMPLAGFQTTHERIQALWNNPELAQQFMDQASFMAKSQGPILKLLTDRNSTVAKSYRQFYESFPSLEELASLPGNTIADFSAADSLERTDAYDRQASSSSDRLQTSGNDWLTNQSQAVKNFKQAREDAGFQLGYWDKRYLELSDWTRQAAGYSQGESAARGIDQLLGLLEDKLRQRESLASWWGVSGSEKDAMRELIESTRDQAAATRELLDHIKNNPSQVELRPIDADQKVGSY